MLLGEAKERIAKGRKTSVFAAPIVAWRDPISVR
jgi:hypothetical protein